MRPVIVTIDTESHEGKDPVSKLIWGETEDGRYGIELIMDIFDEAGAKVLFFVDFAECADFGKETIRKVTDCILKRGHDIGVHLHPDHMKDPDRLFLDTYTYEEQKEMIVKCTELYRELVGKLPLSFRAGKYAANYDTLNILCELGYQYDFSQFYGQKWCAIHPPLTVNAPVKYKTLTEFPVSMFQGVHVGKLKREDKIDIEIMSIPEMRYALDQTVNVGFPMAVTLFLHSFSLLDWRGHPDTPFASQENIAKTKAAAAYVKESPDLAFISEADLESIPVVSAEEGLRSHIKWKNIVKGYYYTYCRAKKVKNKKARMLVWGTRLALIALVAVIIALILILLL